MAESNKTERATPKKRQDERKKGNVFQSKDAISVVVILVSFILVSKLCVFISMEIKLLFMNQMRRVETITELTIPMVGQVTRDMIFTIFVCTIPILLIICFTVIIMSGVQTKFLITPEVLKPKFSRIDIISGMKRFISVKSTVNLIKSILKVMVVLLIIYSSLKGLLVLTPDMLTATLSDNITFMVDKIMSMTYKICLLFVGISIIDWSYEKYDYEKKLKMTKQEIKDEYKQTEGDPFIKGKRRERQRKLSMNRMIQQVPQADVIIRNPTHFAIALKYDIDKDQAPIVLAKGQDLIAKRIIEVAEKHNILMKENKPLARSLYEAVDVNEYIPVEFFNAVAEVMAWVYKAKKDKKPY